MGDHERCRILAAEEGGGSSNFLVPNGTFFFVLVIFLIVLGVIGKWVVPPISKVLRERDAMVQQDGRGQPSRRPSSSPRPTSRLPEAVMAKARGEASKRSRRGPRRRAQGRRGQRGRADASKCRRRCSRPTEQLKEQAMPSQADLRSSRGEPVVRPLASRVLGVEISHGPHIGDGAVARCRLSSDSWSASRSSCSWSGATSCRRCAG